MSVAPNLVKGNSVRITLMSNIDASVFTGHVVGVDVDYLVARAYTDLASYHLSYQQENSQAPALEDMNYLLIREQTGEIRAFATEWLATVEILDPQSTTQLTLYNLNSVSRQRLIGYLVSLGIVYKEVSL